MQIRCTDFLESKKEQALPQVIVIFGDETFLKRQALAEVRRRIAGSEEDEGAFTNFRGDAASLSTVLDELFTVPMFGEHRLVIIEEADEFVTKHRPALLKYVEAPSEVGTLVLEVKTWSSATNLAKVVEKLQLAIECKGILPRFVAGWCTQWASLKYRKKLDKPTAEWLVELVGSELGLLDQELAKLAVHSGDKPQIERAAVDKLVVGSRAENVFKLLELVLDGRVGEALRHLDRQLVAGETPVGILAMVSSQLRKLTRAARETVAGKPIAQAVGDAGIAPFFVEKSVAQLKKIGRERMWKMYRKMLEADAALKGGSALRDRVIIERFLVELVL